MPEENDVNVEELSIYKPTDRQQRDLANEYQLLRIRYKERRDAEIALEKEQEIMRENQRKLEEMRELNKEVKAAVVEQSPSKASVTLKSSAAVFQPGVPYAQVGSSTAPPQVPQQQNVSPAAGSGLMLPGSAQQPSPPVPWLILDGLTS